MAQTFLAAAMGAAANDGSGAKIRAGGLLIAADLAELYAAVAALQAALITAPDLFRARFDEVCTTPASQAIAFSSPFVTDDFVVLIDDPNGLGIEVTSRDYDGFTITAGSAGTFGYAAIIRV